MSKNNIFKAADIEADAPYGTATGVHTNVAVTSEYMQLVWVKFDPGGTYKMHSHPHEQMGVMIQGQMRLTVGEETDDIGPGDMWYAAANVPHGGELLGDTPIIFIDVYGPPSTTIMGLIEQRRSDAKRRGDQPEIL
jgi:quercetin dioxygenase-like cupin family protein